MVPPVQYGGDEVSAIVVDIGSHSTRAGYAGEDCPKVVFPTSYATVPPAHGSDKPPTYIHGNGSLLYRPRAVLSSPLTDGLITDWSAVSRTLDHAFKDGMRLETLEDYPLLTTEPAWNTKENREKFMEIAFEQWNVPAYYGVDKSVVSAFASGKGTALVIDVGDDGTSVVPIYDGFVLRKAVQRQPVGGHLISQVLLSALSNTTPPTSVVPHYLVKSKEPVEPDQPPKASLRDERLPNPEDPNALTTPSFHHAQQLRLMHEFKETVCEVYNSPWDEASVVARPSRPFEYPNGFNSYYGALRFKVPEILFNAPAALPQFFKNVPLPASAATIPSHGFNDLQTLPKLVHNALIQVDPDLHASLMANVVVTGGTTLMPGFVDRLQAELSTVAGSMKLKIHAPSSPAERMYSSWLGGSILASLGTFHQLWIGRDEYKEVGAARLSKK